MIAKKIIPMIVFGIFLNVDWIDRESVLVQ